MNSPPTFSQLTPDNRIWRIDWFGDVAYPGAVRRYRHPCIRVVISPLLAEPDGDLTSYPIETDLSAQQNVWMPVGSLGMLRIGELWKDGLAWKMPSYSREVFSDLDINPLSTSIIKAGLSIDDEYLLPFHQHPWHRLHTHSYCVMVQMKSGSQLVIPGPELIRFYFGSCSILLHLLFTRPLLADQLWRERHFDQATKHLHLKLADGIPRFAVPDIARIATNTHAMHAAASIYSHCLKATACSQEAYPYCGFPFQGKTSLAASGSWLPFAGNSKMTFLVYHLHSCSHPFNFASVTYDPCENAHWRSDKNECGGGKEKRAAQRANDARPSELADTDPGKTKQPRKLLFDDSVRFPDLKRKPIRPREVVAGTVQGILLKHADGSVELISFGHPEGHGDVRSIDTCITSTDAVIAPEQKLPTFVINGMKIAIAQHVCEHSAVAKPLLPFGATEPVFQLPMIVTEDGEVNTCSLFMEPDGHHRPRRGCFLGLFEGENKVTTVVVIEGTQLGPVPLVARVGTADAAELIYMLNKNPVLAAALPGLM